MAPLRDTMRSEVARLAEQVGASPQHLPDWDYPRGDATPHVELHGDLMSWVVSERGRDYERRNTADLEEWLSWVFTAVTGSMAGDWELQKRIPYVEPRLTSFAKHLELLERLNPAWAETQLARYVEILSKHPCKTTSYAPTVVRTAEDFLVGTVRMSNPEEDSADGAAATAALIADGLRRNGLGIDEIRRIDTWVRRLPAP